MTVFLILAFLGLLAALERFGTPASLAALRFRGSTDRILAEPGEVLTWSSSVENHSRFPIPFVRLQLPFPADAKPEDSPLWKKAHLRDGVQGWYAEEKLSLPPRRSITRTVRFSLSERGIYTVGKYRMAAGDLLGFREEAVEGPGKKVVVMPHRSRDPVVLKTLGGFLGDLSVRRFLLEDPILTVGFREYTGREPQKAISWTRTAIAGSLQVKQYDHTAQQTASVLLDTSDASPEQIEACFRLARSACEALEKQKIPFSFRTNGSLSGPTGKVHFIPEGLGERHLSSILYCLGTGEYTCFFSRRTLVRQALDSRKSNEAFLVITAAAESEKQVFRPLETAVGNPVCFLIGREEVPAP